MSGYNKNGNNISLSISKTRDETGYIKVPLFYYYGYTAVSNTGEKLNILSGENGCLTCIIDNNDISSIYIHFRNNRKIFRYPEIISIRFIVISMCYYNCSKKMENKNIK